MPGDKQKLGCYVDRDAYEDFVAFVIDKHGTKKGNLGRELSKAMESWSSGTDVDALERRLASMEGRLDAMADTLSRVDRERENDSSSGFGGSSDSYNARTERKVDAIEQALPEGTDVDDSIVEHVIEEHGGTARKTVKKYKRLLRNRGIAFPVPDEQSDPSDLDVGSWVVGRQKFAMRLEANEAFSPDAVDRIVGEYDAYLGEDWYLEALPNAWLENHETKLEKTGDSSAKKRIQDWRRVHGLLDQDDERRAFQ